MRDPVVASDGNSYEREAIEAVLRGANKRSPLTREPLEPHLFANRNLRKRIEEHEEEVLRVAATAAATAGEAAVAGERAAASASALGAGGAGGARGKRPRS